MPHGRCTATVALLLALTVLPANAAPGPAFLVHDINTRDRDGALQSTPRIGIVGDIALFFADDGTGSRLWASDERGGNTSTIADLRLPIGPAPMAMWRDYLYFAACPRSGSDCGLWRSDGTSAGTTLVRALTDDQPRVIAAAPDRLYVITRAGLWRSDGTEEGTQLAKQFGGERGAYDLTAVDNEAYLAVEIQRGTQELWRSDGTDSGTVRVKTFTGFDGIFGFNELSGLLVFAAEIQPFVYRLWRSDGTTDGTTQVGDVPPGQLVSGGNRVFFISGSCFSECALWTSDGTPGGTMQLKTSLGDGATILPQSLGGEILFRAGSDL